MWSILINKSERLNALLSPNNKFNNIDSLDGFVNKLLKNPLRQKWIKKNKRK